MPPSPIDPARLAALPADLRALFRAQEAMIEAERRRADDECSARLHVESELAASKESVERLELLVKEYERARFGKRSEKFNPDQMQLVLEDIEIAIAEVQERQDDRARRAGTAPSSRRTRRAARAFPAHLPRIEQVIEPENLECPCGCGRMVQIGEDRSRRLDVMAAQYRVIETVRPRYACAKGCTGVAQAPAPAHLVEGGIPTEALLAQVAVAKFSEHMPLYRQSQVLARHGIFIDRAVLADWMGTVAFHLAPLVERMSVVMKQSGRLFIDETRAPVLDPGRGRTKTGYLWAVLRDDRGHGGADPPIVVYHYAPGRGGDHAERILEGFDGILQVDGYQGYHRLARPKRKGGVPLRLAACWSHSRRKIIAATPKAGSPIAEAVLARIAALYAIEKEIRGADAPARQTTRNERSRPLVAELERFLREQAARLSPGSEMGKAIAYLLNHWDGLTLFLDDGCVEMDTNPVENQIRPLTLTRKNSLFAGHDEGGRSWARIASLITTCKINSVEPYVWMKATLKAIATGHPQSRIDELLPWSFGRTS
uniref:IS66 family transposase n=2 Tax=Bradyrhizobium barranii subsp. barranii TaxID=2823807 RepID=A0A939MDE4_9BRAD